MGLLSPPLPPMSVVVDVVSNLLSLPVCSGGFSLRWREVGSGGLVKERGGGLRLHLFSSPTFALGCVGTVNHLVYLLDSVFALQILDLGFFSPSRDSVFCRVSGGLYLCSLSAGTTFLVPY